MRKSREELLTMYPSWNEAHNDIVATLYGDEPLFYWNAEEYERYSKLDGTLANIEAVDAYIYTQNGDYAVYRTLIGEVKIKTNEAVLCGDITLHYGGQVYSIMLNLMYGFKSLSIMRNGANYVTGFSSKDGIGSPCIKAHTKELSPETIKRILHLDCEDYGYGIQRFMTEVRELYYSDPTNHIMEKCFSMGG